MLYYFEIKILRDVRKCVLANINKQFFLITIAYCVGIIAAKTEMIFAYTQTIKTKY